jgi:hypothetical protein
MVRTGHNLWATAAAAAADIALSSSTRTDARMCASLHIDICTEGLELRRAYPPSAVQCLSDIRLHAETPTAVAAAAATR